MNTIQVLDKRFALYVPYEELLEKIRVTASEINRDLADQNPIFIGVLNGCFMFMGDLMKEIQFPCETEFIRFKSYEGTTQTGNVQQLIGLNVDLTGRNIVVIEDIIDTGRTMTKLLEALEAKNPRSIKVCTLFLKREALQVEVQMDYIVHEIPNQFIIGYGLDYDGYGRNLKDLYLLAE